MKKIIIIGMDNTGKTTLANELSNRLKFKHIKSPGPNFTKEEMYNSIIEQLSSDEDLILERFSIVEEIIYGNRLRNRSKFTTSDLIDINNKYKPLFIYCRPSDEKIFNFGEREQMNGVIDNSKNLLKDFDDLIYFIDKDPSFNIIYYNYENKSIDELEEIINEYNTR